jgi:GATA-binding protein
MTKGKRRATTHHVDSLLRGDPLPGITLPPPEMSANGSVQDRMFPSTAFNFNVPGFDNIFDLSGAASTASHTPDFLPVSDKNLFGGPGTNREDNLLGASLAYVSSTDSLTSSSNRHPYNQALSRNTVSDNVSSLDGHTHPSMPSEEEMHHLLGLNYPVMFDSTTEAHLQNQYTHVDPTHILSVFPNGGEGHFSTNFHPSPSSDEWGTTTGFNSSATASPDMSDPGANNMKGRKMVAMKRSSQIGDGQGSQIQGFVNGNSPSSSNSKGEPSTGQHSGGDLTRIETKECAPGEEASTDLASTICSNCHTTNTPLWRRDADGQPLCMCSPFCISPADLTCQKVTLAVYSS